MGIRVVTGRFAAEPVDVAGVFPALVLGAS
jgi:hypothetical protein